MIAKLPLRFRTLPTPMAGLALGVSSLGWCMENALPLNGWGQLIGAVIATGLLSLLIIRFSFHFDTLLTDLKHPVVGSIVPTFAMCLMVISKAIGNFFPAAGSFIWLCAVIVHIIAFVVFAWHRLHDRRLDAMVPSWFIPPVGMIVTDVSFPGGESLFPLALFLLVVGMVSYAILLPLMLYRLFFRPALETGAQPTLAIMAAPASLCLAGYLTVIKEPNLLICAVLLGIALLMTLTIYFAFWHLLRLQFSPGYAAFTFPMAIGATALYKSANAISHFSAAADYVSWLRWLAHGELLIASVVIFYVFSLYMKNFKYFLKR